MVRKMSCLQMALPTEECIGDSLTYVGTPTGGLANLAAQNKGFVTTGSTQEKAYTLATEWCPTPLGTQEQYVQS